VGKYDISLTPKQSNIYAGGWGHSARFRYVVCGRRFGKTYLAAAEMRRAVQMAVRNNIDADNEIWYGAPTFKQAKRVFWRRLKRVIPKSWIDGRPNETECAITLISGHVVRIVGLDAYDNLRGSGLYFFIGDEWADCPAEAWGEVIRPMLSTCGGHALFIGTPRGYNHFYDGYQAGQSADGDTRSWLYTTVQGGNVPQSEIDAAMRELDKRTFQQEYEGSFVNFSGRVYSEFSRTESVKRCDYNPALPLHIGMDFNINPMSATLWQIKPDGELWQVDEIMIPTSNTGEMCDEILIRYPQAKTTIYPDPAGAQRRTSAQGKTDISILRERGFNVVAMSSHPLVRDRINIVNGKFLSADGKRHAFIDPRCKESIKCYEQLIYRDGTNQPDKNMGLDHLPDATGYVIYTMFAYIPAQRIQIPHMSR
jgi:hypothetical protein